MTQLDTLRAGTGALARGAWAEARSHFQASLQSGETPEALEHLALAAWWLDDAALTFGSRERAYALYRDRDDARSAARVALWLVWDYIAFRGDMAVAAGWLERARRLLVGHEQTAEFGWLLLREGDVALFRGHDPGTARDDGARAAALGRSLGDRAVEFTGLALEGLARVSAGDVAAGMRCLDEATAAATGGEVKELHAVGVVCCWQIFACERVRDYDRAAQWCARVQEFTRRWQLHPLSGVCRSQYAGVLIWRGAWAEAETELGSASRQLEEVRPAMAAQVVARLGDLRLKQGRLDEAAALFQQASSHPLARLGQAALLLERGEAAESAAAVERFLADIGNGEQTLRASCLELAVRAQSASGARAAAAAALNELQRIAAAVGTAPLAAAVAAAEGVVRRGAEDPAGAALAFERAAALYHDSGAPFETARAQLDLAEVLAATDQRATADRLARQALATFRSLGARREETRATRCLKPPVKAAAAEGRPAPPLTERQVEILRLVAQGLSNPEIATRLRLSDHTVKRHVANLLHRLSLPSRAAAVAYAALHGLL